MKQIALTTEQMEHLNNLGVDVSKASMCWVNDTVLALWDKTIQQTFYNSDVSFGSGNKYVPAFTLQDILELLPKFILKDGTHYDLASDMHNRIAYEADWDSITLDHITDYVYLYTERDESNFLDACYRMLCWVAENGYLKNKEEINNDKTTRSRIEHIK